MQWGERVHDFSPRNVAVCLPPLFLFNLPWQNPLHRISAFIFVSLVRNQVGDAYNKNFIQIINLKYYRYILILYSPGYQGIIWTLLIQYLFIFPFRKHINYLKWFFWDELIKIIFLLSEGCICVLQYDNNTVCLPSDNDNDLPKTYNYEEVEVKIDAKGNRTIADLRYQEKDIISPSTLSFAPIKS